MIFVGDIALPYRGALDIDIPSSLKNKTWIGNLEGGLVEDFTLFESKRLVVNHVDAIRELLKNNEYIFTLANNHILDSNDYNFTYKFLKENNISFLGAGNNFEEAAKHHVVDDKKVILLNYGWEVIQCEGAKSDKEGVNSLIEKKIKENVNKILKSHPNYKIVLIMHWDYELESYPMPNQRRMAFELIDMGVEAIIGHHPHRIQGFEIYKDKPIVYSLGNWMFAQQIYHNGKLEFPTFCNDQLAFELDIEKGDHLCHFFCYNKKSNKVEYQNTEKLMDSLKLKEISPFSGMTHKEYDKWFKKNRYHKKFIPVYKSYDSELSIILKNRINKLRDFLIKIILFIKK